MNYTPINLYRTPEYKTLFKYMLIGSIRDTSEKIFLPSENVGT